VGSHKLKEKRSNLEADDGTRKRQLAVGDRLLLEDSSWVRNVKMRKFSHASTRVFDSFIIETKSNKMLYWFKDLLEKLVLL
jgi:hypothetical protein